MSAQSTKLDPRAEELLIDKALFGLQDSEEAKLQELLGPNKKELEESFLKTAALAQIGFEVASQVGRLAKVKPATPDSDRMPKGLRMSILEATQVKSSSNVVSLEQADHKKPVTKSTGITNYSAIGWGLAAAFALALVFLQPYRAEENPADLRAELINDATDAITVPWSLPEISGYENVRGDVVWSDAQQSGYMRLAGLPANDPNTGQYQLWIVDEGRSPQPVDGGVFDVPADQSEVIIPVNAKLAVSSPSAFAITLEKPGGVVVSAGPLLVVAAPGSS